MFEAHVSQLFYPHSTTEWITAEVAVVVSLTLTAGLAGAVHRRDPQVGGAGVKDDAEGLRRGANGDHTIVGQLGHEKTN